MGEVDELVLADARGEAHERAVDRTRGGVPQVLDAALAPPRSWSVTVPKRFTEHGAGAVDLVVGRVAVHQSAPARVITFHVDPGWRPIGWVAMLYWLPAKSGPPTIAFTAPRRGVDRHQRGDPVGAVSGASRCWWRPRPRSAGLVEGGGDLQAALEELVGALLHGGAEARVGEELVLHLGHEVVVGALLGRRPDRRQRLVVGGVGLGLRDVARLHLAAQHVGAPADGAVGIGERVVALGVGDEPGEQRGLADGELVEALAAGGRARFDGQEVAPGRGLDAVGARSRGRWC